jgi:hypothetical protein
VKWPPVQQLVESWGLAVQLSSSREVEKRWRYNGIEDYGNGVSFKSLELSSFLLSVEGERNPPGHLIPRYRVSARSG